MRLQGTTTKEQMVKFKVQLHPIIGMILVYSVIERDSFEHISNWI